jgi:DNA polymerase III subunit alpha
MRGEDPIESVAKRLESPAERAPQEKAREKVQEKAQEKVDGEVAFILLLDGIEVEVRLPGRFKISPQIAGAIKAVPGVVAVEAM